MSSILDDILKQINHGHRKEKLAVCIMKDHDDLNEYWKSYKKENAALNKRLEKLKDEIDDHYEISWESFREKLVSENFLTEKELANRIGLLVEDGVLFKQVLKEENK